MTIDIRKVGSEGNEIRIATKASAQQSLKLTDGTQVRRVSVRANPTVSVDGKSEIRVRADTSVSITTKGPDPLYLIDGQKASKAQIERLSPDRISSVEVIKGEAARSRFGAEGANGVVYITTKK